MSTIFFNFERVQVKEVFSSRNEDSYELVKCSIIGVESLICLKISR